MKVSMLDEPWSWRKLAALFAVSLLLFVVVRWQPGPWLRSNIMDMARQNGLRLDFQTMRIRGFSVHLNNVSIGPPGRTLMLDSLTVSPDWAVLLTGNKGLRIWCDWHGRTAMADLVVHKDYTEIQHIDSRFDVASLQPVWKQKLAFPLHVSGKLRIEGDIRLDARNGRPVGGALTAEWQDAGAAMAGKPYPFGSYRLVMKDEGAAGVWQWRLNGGTAVSVQASGALNAYAVDPAAWTLTGVGTVQAGQGADPGLVGILGPAPIRLRLSGNIGMPRLRRL